MSDNKELDICESYNYLGILFHFNNNFVNAKKTKYCSISFIKSEKEKGGRFSNCLTPTLQAK
jgi:hypothetical protein